MDPWNVLRIEQIGYLGFWNEDILEDKRLPSIAYRLYITGRRDSFVDNSQGFWILCTLSVIGQEICHANFILDNQRDSLVDKKRDRRVVLSSYVLPSQVLLYPPSCTAALIHIHGAQSPDASLSKDCNI